MTVTGYAPDDRAAAVVLAGAGHPGLRLLSGRPPRAVAGRTGQLVVRQPPGDRDVFGRPAHRCHPAGLLPAVGAWAVLARAGDGIVYQAREHQDSWLMVGYGLQYYLARDMPNGVPVPRELFIAHTAAEVGTLYPEPCEQPAACLGAERRIWVIGVGRQTSPYQAVTPAQAAVLRPRYRLSLVKHQRSLTMFLLTRHE